MIIGIDRARFLQIDSKVFRSRTPGDPFDVAQRNRGSFTIFSDPLHYDVPAHVSSWFSVTRQRTIKWQFRSRHPVLRRLGQLLLQPAQKLSAETNRRIE